MSLNENDLLSVILYRNMNFDNNVNISILTATIKFIKDSKRFDKLLLKPFSFLHIVLQLGFLA